MPFWVRLSEIFLVARKTHNVNRIGKLRLIIQFRKFLFVIKSVTNFHFICLMNENMTGFQSFFF